MENIIDKENFDKVVNIIETVEINSRVRQLKDNSDMLIANHNIGKLIFESQNKEKRAKYGQELIKNWADVLEKKYGKNYNKRNLMFYRQFYITFPIVNALRSQLNWTHYKLILHIKDENERNYYINQVIINHLSTRELANEIKNKAFDRLSYTDKDNIELIDSKNNYELSIQDMIKDPILIKTKFDKNDLDEKAIHKLIIDMVEDNFLELGTGFALVSHEYKINIDNRTYKIDLLFFNVELNCYVVVEVKTKENQHKDIGQLEMYMEYINKHIKKISHNLTIGILLVEQENKLIVEYISNPNIFITKYELINE